MVLLWSFAYAENIEKFVTQCTGSQLRSKRVMFGPLLSSHRDDHRVDVGEGEKLCTWGQLDVVGIPALTPVSGVAPGE